MSSRRFKQHWYKTYVGGCPVCGRDKSYRIRVYGKRPKRLSSRYIQLSDRETYDDCLYYT
jgi:hypothetical protein